MRAQFVSSNLWARLSATFLVSILWGSQALAEDTDSHAIAYAQALERLQTAPALLEQEMNRIRSAEVAHFDYLQYAHIELLRDARAVRFPPSSLEQLQRQALTDQADRVLRASTELELVISDFLRAQAALNGALSSTVDIIRSSDLHMDEGTQAKLADLSSAATEFRNNQNQETLATLRHAFTAAIDGRLPDSLKKELASQQTVIETSSEGIERATNTMRATDLNREIAQLAELYKGANTLLGSR